MRRKGEGKVKGGKVRGRVRRAREREARLLLLRRWNEGSSEESEVKMK